MIPSESSRKVCRQVHILQAFTAAGAWDPAQVKRTAFGAWRCASHTVMQMLRDVLHLLASAWNFQVTNPELFMHLADVLTARGSVGGLFRVSC